MREMKDSGIEWIGNIPANWKCIRAKYLFGKGDDGLKIGPFGSAMKGKTQESGPYKIYNQANLIQNDFRLNRHFVSEETFESLKSYEVKEGDILFSMMGTIGKCQIMPSGCPKGIMDSHLLKARLNSLADGRFFLYAYDKDYSDLCISQLEYASNGTIMSGLNSSILKNVVIALPPIEEQLRIVDFLDSKCAQIDSILFKQKAVIEKLGEYKQSIITEAVTRGLRRNCEFKNSGYKWIGDIPSHWKMVYAKQLFSQRKDKAFENDEQLTASQKYGIISQNDFMEIEGRQVMQVIKGEEILKHVGKGDFVISMRSFQGGLEYSEISGKISSAYVMLIPNHDLVYDRYYKWLFKCNRYITALQGTSNLIRDGQALRYSNFTQVYLPVLPIDEQKEIADYLDRVCPKIDEEIAKREELLEKIQEYKKSLIYEIVTGKREVS